MHGYEALVIVTFRVINVWFARPPGERRQVLRLAVTCFHVDLTGECLDGKSEKKRTNKQEERFSIDCRN